MFNVQKIVLIVFFAFISFACKDINKEKLTNIQIETGIASWYGPGFQGKSTANGEKYNMYGFTAAHRKLKFGTLIKVTNLKNNLSVIVRINDRGPYNLKRVTDLSKVAAKKIGMIKSGLADVKLEIIGYKHVNFKVLHDHFQNLLIINSKNKIL